ncbi:hypothetical protein ACJX0J_016269, partial [Zea mays]
PKLAALCFGQTKPSHIELGRSLDEKIEIYLHQLTTNAIVRLSVILGATILHTERIPKEKVRTCMTSLTGQKEKGFLLEYLLQRRRLISDVVPEKNVAETTLLAFLYSFFFHHANLSNLVKPNHGDLCALYRKSLYLYAFILYFSFVFLYIPPLNISTIRNKIMLQFFFLSKLCQRDKDLGWWNTCKPIAIIKRLYRLFTMKLNTNWLERCHAAACVHTAYVLFAVILYVSQVKNARLLFSHCLAQ